MQIPKPYHKCSLTELWLRKCYTCGYVYMCNSSCFNEVWYSRGKIEYDSMCISCRKSHKEEKVAIIKIKNNRNWLVYNRFAMSD